MSDWPTLMRRPSNLPLGAEEWFTQLAERLMNGSPGTATTSFFLDEVAPTDRPLFRSARVGLSLKKARAAADMPRYLSEPRRTPKGKNSDEICQLTGCTRSALQRYLADYEAGRQESDFQSYIGVDLNPKDLCRLHAASRAIRENRGR